MNSTTYPYYDENGQPLYRVVVEKLRDSPKKVRIESYNNGHWQVGLNRARKVPYNLPACLLAIANNETIWIPEGERDCNTLCEAGLVATTNPMGAMHWQDDFSELLSGGRFAVIGDLDEAGRKHVAQVVESLLNHADPVDVRVKGPVTY